MSVPAGTSTLGAVLADPSLLWHEPDRRWYAYGTSPTPPGGTGEGPFRAFWSADQMTWHYAGEILPNQGLAQWSPAVAHDAGTYYLYFSTGRNDGLGHQVQVATSDSPTGPFTPSGIFLDPGEPFSIDARPWRDPADGQWYFYYCTDFLDGERPGTGIVVDRMVSMTQLAGEKKVVARPAADWQIYERDRDWYGRVWPAWSTVEGPSVRRFGDRVVVLFSGGNWQRDH